MFVCLIGANGQREKTQQLTRDFLRAIETDLLQIESRHPETELELPHERVEFSGRLTKGSVVMQDIKISSPPLQKLNARAHQYIQIRNNLHVVSIEISRKEYLTFDFITMVRYLGQTRRRQYHGLLHPSVIITMHYDLQTRQFSQFGDIQTYANSASVFTRDSSAGIITNKIRENMEAAIESRIRAATRSKEVQDTVTNLAKVEIPRWTKLYAELLIKHNIIASDSKE